MNKNNLVFTIPRNSSVSFHPWLNNNCLFITLISTIRYQSLCFLHFQYCRRTCILHFGYSCYMLLSTNMYTPLWLLLLHKMIVNIMYYSQRNCTLQCCFRQLQSSEITTNPLLWQKLLLIVSHLLQWSTVFVLIYTVLYIRLSWSTTGNQTMSTRF